MPGLIAGSGLVATAYGVGVMGSSHASECTPQVVTAPARGSYDVRVFNASGIDKVAGTAAKELAARGFRVTQTSGVPEGKMQNAVDIAYGKDGLDGALLLASQVEGARLVNDGRQGSAVSLVLGSHFSGLVAVPPPAPPKPSELTVNVYNTTFRSGLAGDVEKALVGRGFGAGTSGNDPLGGFLPDAVAVIRYGPDSRAAAQVLAQHVPGATLQQVARHSSTGRAGTAGASATGLVPGPQYDPTLDLVLGNRYTDLAPAASIPPVPVEAPKPPETVARPCTA